MPDDPEIMVLQFLLAQVVSTDEAYVCLFAKAQERLMIQDWPEELLRHELCKPVFTGDLVGMSPELAGKGDVIISGLRVRMGINTGEQHGNAVFEQYALNWQGQARMHGQYSEVCE